MSDAASSDATLAGARPATRLFLSVALLAIGIVWGGTVTLAQVAVSSGTSPVAMTVWELCYATVLLGSVCLLTRRALPLGRRWLSIYAGIAVFGTVLPNLFSYWAAFHLPGGVIALVLSVIPMMTLALAVVLGTDTFTPGKLAGLLLGCAGVALLALPDLVLGEGVLPDPAVAVFLLVALVPTLCYAVEANLVSATVPESADPLAVLLGSFVVGLAIAAPAALASGRWSADAAPWNLPHWERAEWALMGLTLGHVLAYCGYLWVLSRAGPVFSSQVSYVVTAAGVVLSILFLGEESSLWLWAAFALLMAGVALVRPRA